MMSVSLKVSPRESGPGFFFSFLFSFWGGWVRSQVRLFAERHLVKGKRVERARQTWRCRDGTSVQMMVSARPITVKGGPEGSRTLILVHTSSL